MQHTTIQPLCNMNRKVKRILLHASWLALLPHADSTTTLTVESSYNMPSSYEEDTKKFNFGNPPGGVIGTVDASAPTQYFRARATVGGLNPYEGDLIADVQPGFQYFEDLFESASYFELTAESGDDSCAIADIRW